MRGDGEYVSVCTPECVFAEMPDWGAHLPIPPKRYFISKSFTIQAEEQSFSYACLHSNSTGPSRTPVAACGKSKEECGSREERRSPFIIS